MPTANVGMGCNRPPTHQADAVLTQANPVSGTQYSVLTVRNARIIAISAETTGGTVQTLQVHITIDGQTITMTFNNPVGGTQYVSRATDPRFAPANQALIAVINDNLAREFLIEGRDIAITAEVTWTVQPSPLECRVIYATYQ